MAENMNSYWLIGSLIFLAGLLVGAAINYILAGGARGSNKIGTQLSELQKEFKEYQQEVGDHFTTTAHLINKLTETYRDIHAHMAEAAQTLVQDGQAQNLLNDTLLSNNVSNSRRNERPKSLKQPKDYAPKGQSEHGLLEEGYGLHDSKKEESA